MASGEFAIARSVDDADFSVTETRNFTSSDDKNVSSIVMKTADVPEEFQCPIFSNSPYSDILTAIDSLQNSINVFPKCGEADKSNDLMSASSEDLRKQILTAQSMQNSGDTKKLGISAQGILSSVTKLQDLIGKVSTSSETDCYKSEKSKSLIFSINDTFQSIAPLAIDFATKNPTLAPMLAPYLPAVAGAKAISKGISILESALAYAATLDMSIAENRMSVIKNTCAYVKLYRKIEYLNMGRALGLKKINEDFQSKINKSIEIQKAVANSDNRFNSTSPKDIKIAEIQKRSIDFEIKLDRANAELANKKMSDTDLSTCSVVRTVYAMKISGKILADLSELGQIMTKEDQVSFKKTNLESFEAEMNEGQTLKDKSACAKVGQDWLQAQTEALAETKSLLVDYNEQLQMSSTQFQNKMIQSREKKKEADYNAEKNKLKLFYDLSVFEPGEVEKRMRGMPKYLFNGTEGNWYTKLKKNGPIYDLLQNNEDSFQAAMNRFKTNIGKLLNFEYQMFRRDAKGAVPSPASLKAFAFEKNNFAHLTTSYIKKGSDDFRDLCAISSLAITDYVAATDHLVSSEAMCEMIRPVLKEAEVSDTLRKYCQSSRSALTNKPLRPGYVELARTLYGMGGPKEQVEALIQKRNALACDI